MAKYTKRHGRRSRRHSQNQSQSQNQQNSLFGGEGGAAEYLKAVVGAPAEQHAGSPPSNAIAVTPMAGGSGLSVLSPAVVSSSGNLMSGGSAVPSMYKGGKGKKGKKGGNLLQQLAVPAVLLYANNTFGRRGSKSSGRKTRRFRGSRRFRK